MIAPLANAITSPEAVTKMATDTYIGNNHNTSDLTAWQQCVNTVYCAHRTLFSTCIFFIIMCLQGFQCSNPQFDPHLYLNQAYCMCCKLPKEAGKPETKQSHFQGFCLSYLHSGGMLFGHPAHLKYLQTVYLYDYFITEAKILARNQMAPVYN